MRLLMPVFVFNNKISKPEGPDRNCSLNQGTIGVLSHEESYYFYHGVSLHTLGLRGSE